MNDFSTLLVDEKAGIYEMDIKEISGSTNIGAYASNGGSIKIRAIWLEK